MCLSFFLCILFLSLFSPFSLPTHPPSLLSLPSLLFPFSVGPTSVAPDVTADMQELVDVPVGIGTLQISCTYFGIPAPNAVTWTHNSSATPLDRNDPRITIVSNETSTTLTITEMMEDEGGSYECIPENLVGSNSATTQVRIQCKWSTLTHVK